VHGGPGSGCSTGPRKSFDPDRYRSILFRPNLSTSLMITGIFQAPRLAMKIPVIMEKCSWLAVVDVARCGAIMDW